jgi:hypothetical protein
MQLISERVAAGLEVNPGKTHRKKKQHINETALRGANTSKHFTSPSMTSLNSIEPKQKDLTFSSSNAKKLAPGKGASHHHSDHLSGRSLLFIASHFRSLASSSSLACSGAQHCATTSECGNA